MLCPGLRARPRDRRSVGAESHTPRASAHRCSSGHCRSTQGPWLRSEFCCLAPSSLTTTPSVSLMSTRRFRGPAVYTSRLRCAGAPRRPTRPSLLSLPRCPHVPSTIHRWVRPAVPLLVRGAVPGFLGNKTSRHPRPPSLPAILDRKSISVLHRSRYATARVFASPS